MSSHSDETSVRATISCPQGGRILTSGFPGLQTGIDGSAYIDPHNLKETLAAIGSSDALSLVVLTEHDELPEDAVELLLGAAQDVGLPVEFLPIPDYHAPDDATLTQWHALSDRLNWPGHGQTIAFCCQYGAGRSGTMAAYSLMCQGMTETAAIEAIRAEFPESIESDVQLEFLKKISARLKEPAADLDPD